MHKIPIAIATEIQFYYFDSLTSNRIWAAQAIADLMYETLRDLITPFQNILFFIFKRIGFILDHKHIEKIMSTSNEASPVRANMTYDFRFSKIDLF